MPWLHGVQAIFLLTFVCSWVLQFHNTRRDTRPIKWVVDAGLLATAIPLLFPRPENPWIPWADAAVWSPWFLIVVLLCYSGVVLSQTVIGILGSRTNPSLILATSFIFFILLGSFLLLMPRCTVNGISYVDSLFVATSAVCITGLTPVDVASTFTPLGLTVLGALMQIGALGVMTFTSFFALFFSGNTSIHSQLMVKDMIYSKTINSLLPTLLYILIFTICIEFAGATAIFWSVHDTLGMSVRDELAFAAFHAVSAFCNAGFSNIPGGMSNPALLSGNQLVYVVLTVLILAGGIGFPILVNARDAIVHQIGRLWNCRPTGRRGKKKHTRIIHIYNMNTKIVLVTTLSLLVAGTILFWIFEGGNSMAGMSPWEKLVQSVFNSITPRSAGFASVNPSGFLNITVVMLMFLMWVGGASQSTAGGIKVNAFAAIILNLRAIVLGRSRVTAFGRTVAPESIRRANAVVTLSILCYVVYSFALMTLEPHIGTRELLFESCSALFTVGSSLGTTALLGSASKVVLCTAMFLGRVGLISLLVGIAGNRRDNAAVGYPTDNIIIN